MISLQHIFIAKPNQRLYSKENLVELKLQPAFIKKMSNQLDLIYLENNSTEGNVCLANSEEVRAEYRTIFTKADVIHYVNHQISVAYIDLTNEQVLFPIHATIFFA